MYSAIPFDDKRAKYMNFTSNDIFQYNASLVKNINDISKYKNLKQELSRKTIAIVKSSSLGNFVKRKYPQAKYIEVKKTADGFSKLQEGSVDLFAINSATADYMINIKGYKDLKVVAKLDYIFRLKIAISKTMPKEVLSIINKTLGQIDKHEINDIYDKWMNHIIIEKETDWQIVIYTVLFLIIVIGIFIYKQYMTNKSLEDFDELINSTLEGLIILKDGVCVDLNKSAINIFGYGSKKEAVGLKLFDHIADESKEFTIKQHTQNTTEAYEVVLLKKDKTRFYALVRGQMLKNKGLRLSSIIDISDLKEKEKLLFEQSKLASMGEMIGNIAHQWRQPLSVISTASTGMLVQKEYNILTDKLFVETCNTINNNAQYLSKTIDDFKNFIKGDRTKGIFDLNKDIDSFLHLVEGSIKNHNINIILDLEDGIKIDGYKNELTQCLMNIFNNAKDALNENTEENKIIFITTLQKDDKVIIKIKDNAGGIPEDIINKIFEPYFTTKHQSQGTGLGLHMTYNLIVDGMGGTIEANNAKYEYDDNEYSGAEFIIFLPMS